MASRNMVRKTSANEQPCRSVGARRETLIATSRWAKAIAIAATGMYLQPGQPSQLLAAQIPSVTARY